MSTNAPRPKYFSPVPGEQGRVSGSVTSITTITATTRLVRPVVFA